MSDRFPGGVISKTPPTVVAPVDGEGGSASGVWTLDEVLGYEKAGAWPKGILPRELYAWGYNRDGQLGDGTTASRSSPIQIGSLQTWASVTASNAYSYVDAHSAAIRTDNTLWAWGNNLNGQLGFGDTASRSSPVQVGALTDWKVVSAGGRHTAAVKTNGTLWGWGDNYFGQVGNNVRPTDARSPVQIGALTDWVSVDGGATFSAALKNDGTLWMWGRNQWGQLGQNNAISRSSPVQVGALTDWVKIKCGGAHSLAIKTNGTLWSWGRNDFGQLGNGTAISRSSPVQVGALTDWVEVSSGLFSSVAIKTNGTLWGWGQNYNGQLGDGTTISRSSPVQIGALTNWLTAALGSVAAAVKTDGTLWSWGSGSNGAIGDNTNFISRSSPVQIGALTNWSQVAASRINTLAITKG